jgi:hypothetical protein
MLSKVRYISIYSIACYDIICCVFFVFLDQVIIIRKYLARKQGSPAPGRTDQWQMYW